LSIIGNRNQTKAATSCGGCADDQADLDAEMKKRASGEQPPVRALSPIPGRSCFTYQDQLIKTFDALIRSMARTGLRRLQAGGRLDLRVRAGTR
jgi:hypothetical protein